MPFQRQPEFSRDQDFIPKTISLESFWIAGDTLT